MSERKNDEQWRWDEMLPDEADLNECLEEINEVSVLVFHARNTLKELKLPKEYANSQKRALTALNEALMLVDDSIAIVMDEMGVEF
jgi:hypothetical protein